LARGATAETRWIEIADAFRLPPGGQEFTPWRTGNPAAAFRDRQLLAVQWPL